MQMKRPETPPVPSEQINIKEPQEVDKKYDNENPFTKQEIAAQWINSVEGEKGLWRDSTLYPNIRGWMKEFNDGKAVILDIGSGQGIVSSEISGYGEYIGVEPSQFLTDRAQTLYPADNRKFIVGNAYELPLPANSVDGAISINVWFHLLDIKKASNELARVLKPGGKFFINTADNDSMEAWKSFYINPKIDSEKMEGEVKVPVNNMTMNTFYLHTNQQIVDYLKSAGLEVTKQTKTLEVECQTLFITFEGFKK